MQHIKLLEDYFYGQEGNTQNTSTSSGGFTGWSVPNRGKAGMTYLNMLPKGLRNELTRPVKDMLINSNASDWDTLDYIMPKIEKLMAKSGLQWDRFPAMRGISGIKSIGHFVNLLEKGYYQALEDAYFS
jgi:hypothetical protein